MGLFDKLKSLVSDDKKDTGTIEIVAPNRLATKWSRR